jgi:hypothetical protein
METPSAAPEKYRGSTTEIPMNGIARPVVDSPGLTRPGCRVDSSILTRHGPRADCGRSRAESLRSLHAPQFGALLAEPGFIQGSGASRDERRPSKGTEHD